MATVTITGSTTRDSTARQDNRPWYVEGVGYQDGGDGGVITPRKSRAFYPVAGVLTMELEAGIVAYVTNPDGDQYLVTVPDEDSALWDLIAAAVAYPPDTSQERLNVAVGQYVEANRQQFRTRAVPVDPEDPDTLYQWVDSNGDDVGDPVELVDIVNVAWGAVNWGGTGDDVAHDARQAIDADPGELPTFKVSSYFGSWGAGDDTAAIQAALDAAADAGGSAGRGGRVVIPYLNGYIPKASQLAVPYGVTLTGGAWSSFGGKLRQLSGVNDDFIILADNGNAGSNPWGGPCVIEKLSLIGAPGSTAGHAIAWRFPDGRKAKIQDLTTLEKLFIVGFAGSGFYAVGCGPLYIRDVNAIFNGGYGIELVDPQNFEAGALGHISLENISGDGNKGYLSDKGGATVYLEGIKSFYGCSLHGIKSEYRLGIDGYGGNSTTMGNRNAVLIKNCAGAIDVSGLTHISSYGQTRKPDAAIRVIGNAVPNLTWRGASIRSTLTGQTVDWNGDAATAADPVPIVRNDVEGYVSYFTSGKIGPEANLPVNPISSNLATDPDFENTLLWKQDMQSGVSLSTTQKASGARSLKIVADGSTAIGAYLFRDVVSGRATASIGAKPVNPGESWRASVRVFRPSANSGTGRLNIQFEFTDSQGVASPATNTTQVIGADQSGWTADSWTANTLTVCGTVPAGYDRMQVRVVTSTGTPPTSGDIFYIDGVRIEPEVIGSRTHAATSKTTPVDADEFVIADSVVIGNPATSWIKKVTFANLKATLKTYFDSLTTTLTNKTMSGASNTFTNISADSCIDGTTNKVYTATEQTKLSELPSGIELTSGEGTLSRREVNGSSVASGNGNLRLTYFTAKKTETITQIRTMVNTAAVGASLARVGIYSVDGSGNLTLVASIADDHSNLWIAATTVYTRSLSASWSKVKGTRYAIGILVVGTSTAPTFYGQSTLLASECGIAPRISGILASQTDLPSSITAGSVGDSGHQTYVALLP